MIERKLRKRQNCSQKQKKGKGLSVRKIHMITTYPYVKCREDKAEVVKNTSDREVGGLYIYITHLCMYRTEYCICTYNKYNYVSYRYAIHDSIVCIAVLYSSPGGGWITLSPGLFSTPPFASPWSLLCIVILSFLTLHQNLLISKATLTRRNGTASKRPLSSSAVSLQQPFKQVIYIAFVLVFVLNHGCMRTPWGRANYVSHCH